MLDIARFSTTEPDPVILVVDDMAIIRDLLSAGLRRHGLKVQVASDGQEAIELYRQGVDEITHVLLDIQMPGLDGPEVLTALQTLDPDVRAYFMTGDPGRYCEDGLLAMGALRVFAKPLDISALEAEFRKNLVPAIEVVKC